MSHAGRTTTDFMTTENPIQPQTKPEPQAPALRSGDLFGSSRLDFFAAHALQGLLASGKFTQDTEDGEWAILDCQEECDADGNETGRKRRTARAVELAWRCADWMVRDQPNIEVSRTRERE